jgi:hypothetical protein
MKKILSAAAVLGMLALPGFAFQGAAKPAATAAATAWTGYITDTHCGKNGATKDHTAACVQKCMKGGSKAQLFNEADSKLYDLDSFDKVKDLVGKKVTIKGTIDTATNTITVQSAEKVG